MNALIVGGDRITPYRDFLAQRGYAEIHHWSGRNQSDSHRRMPNSTQLIVVLVDYANHSLVRNVKVMAQKNKIPIIFSRRCASQIGTELAQLVKKAA